MEILKVHQFGPIAGLDITLKKVNVFIGEQGVGKSTLAKLLSCCRDYFLYYLILHNMDKNLIDQIFSSYGIQTYFKPDSYIEYTNAEGWCLIYCEGNFSISNPQYGPEDSIKVIDRIVFDGIRRAYGNLMTHGKDLTTADIRKILEDNTKIIISNLRSSFYCPAERGIASVLSNSLASIFISNIPLPQPLLEYMSFFEKARLEYPSFSIPFLGLSYSYEDGKDIVNIDGDKVQLRCASSGIQSIVPLLMVIEYCLRKNYFSSFTIEEPELNLFPTNQLHFLQSLISKTNKDSGNLGTWTLTTHSPYLLAVFNLSLLAGRIVDKFPDYSESLYSIIPQDYILKPGDVAVYELRRKDIGTTSCVSIIDDTTDLIKGNYLDSVSDIISADFHQLYKLYIRLSKASVKNNVR